MPRLVIERGLRVPMRDGVELVADLYRPETDEPLPTLMQRTPYDRLKTAYTILPVDVIRLAETGYAIVMQDSRGRGDSGGTFTPFLDDLQDGADSIAWAAAQPWSNGRVGMFGQSYNAAAQWLAASQDPPALKAIAPIITSGDYLRGWIYRGGALELGFVLLWTLMFLEPGELIRRGAPAEEIARVIGGADDIERLYPRLPLPDQPAIGDGAPYYAEWLEHPDDGPFWERMSPVSHPERINVPALNFGGWYDLFIGGTLASYTAMRARGGSAEAREGQRLIVGPWAHGVTGGTFIERSFGLGSGLDAIDVTGLHRAWFDAWLKDDGSGGPPGKRVRLFVMGADTWREEDDWPLPDTDYVDWFLHGGGSAATLDGDGMLSRAAPGDEPPDTYSYDPHDPVPTVGGATFLPGVWLGVNAGPRDQRSVETRPDVLCYTSEPLAQPLEVIGPVEVVLYASSSARDTDFVARLVDVAPSGRASVVCDGILRARYRHSMSAPALLEPGTVEEFRIDLAGTAYRFMAGHRLRVDITSSCFPRWDRNTNTGGVVASETLDDAVVAVNRVHHEQAYRSRIVLPVIDRR